MATPAASYDRLCSICLETVEYLKHAAVLRCACASDRQCRCIYHVDCVSEYWNFVQSQRGELRCGTCQTRYAFDEPCPYVCVWDVLQPFADNPASWTHAARLARACAAEQNNLGGSAYRMLLLQHEEVKFTALKAKDELELERTRRRSAEIKVGELENELKMSKKASDEKINSLNLTLVERATQRLQLQYRIERLESQVAWMEKRRRVRSPSCCVNA
jgi:hypothetical protein